MHNGTLRSRPVRAVNLKFWHAIIAGLCANLVGIGLARFAYTPLIPSLIQAHWFKTSDVVYLGAANLAGYFVGALIGRHLARFMPNVSVLRGSMLLATASFAACAVPLSVTWFFAWRLLSGIAGGVIMVLVAGTILPFIPKERKSLASGLIFLGLGLGIAASGTVIPVLLQFGIQETWCGLAILAFVLTLVSWWGWPVTEQNVQESVNKSPTTRARMVEPSKILSLFYVQFSLIAFALVPMMVFLADFIARGLDKGPELGAFFWVLYGIGAIFGPPLYAFLSDYMGPQKALRIVFITQAALIGLFAATDDLIFLGIMAIALGTFPPGIVPLALARIHQLVPNDASAQTTAWSRATTLFSICQAGAGYGYSYMFNLTTGNHRLLFVVGTASLLVAFVLSLCGKASKRKTHD